MRRLAPPALFVVALACAAPPPPGGDAGSPWADAGADAGTVAADGGPPDGGAPLATVVVHYDTGPGHSIALRGSGGPLDWAAGAPLTWNAGNLWEGSFALSAPVACKPLFDDATWAVGPNWTLAPGQRLDIWPFFFHQAGAIQQWSAAFASQILGDSRAVWVYTPPSYAENAAESYPVLYLQDGQNLFYDQDSFSGVSWDVGGAMDQGAEDGTIREAIVVGIDNDADRIWEYTPTPGGMDGGGASQYLQFVTTELEPAIDASFRTLTDRGDTLIGGSSLGGLLAAYAGLVQAQRFGLILVMSPSTWWDNEWIVGQVASAAGAPLKPDRVYLDSGDAGVDGDDVTLTAALAQAYEDAGVPLDYLVQAGGQHGEAWWRQRFPGAAAYLLGPRQ
ncbi:MAG: alpha/beta hydrolase [Myxococcales bacterium]